MKPTQCLCARFPRVHERQRLCGIGFNEFLGEVQARLIKLGYAPPVWPDAKIRDQGDLDDALDSCVQWCAARLDACGEADQRDASRYRWLRHHPAWESEAFLNGLNAPDFDVAVDVAMASQPVSEGKP